MSFLKINGTALPDPKNGVKVKVSTIVDAGRNANGVVIGQRIGRDIYKIDSLEWPLLSANTWGSILRLLGNFYFDVTFPDPVSGQLITVPMYCGDRDGEPCFPDENNVPQFYRNCRVNLIDTGA